ncbi:uncharacterized protein N7459_008070 [Penicillium hispanicum]|uniref:uncharacterized protein n=1 Tax=Penicillium hispanicum TaxID=1080232 RepID=UPI0025405801|nr:uncharacterized protein N7459_008070 [Penicillium hispanicum]KAJ5573643.1 hypothetical protein N7459_008070 [Penicillium hispanicum]
MADPRYASNRDLVQGHEQYLETVLQQGVYKPIFLYHVILFHCLPIVGLIIPCRNGFQCARPFIFTLCLGFAIEVFRNHRAVIGGNGYMLGLMTAWWLVWCATLFVFTDLEHDFQRIERAPAVENEPSTIASCTPLADAPEEDLGQTDLDDQPICSLGVKVVMASKSVPVKKREKTACAEQDKKFHWQSYPQKLSHRLDWCAGLLFNLRGPEWNWRAPHLGPLPPSVHVQLHSGSSASKSVARDDTASVDSYSLLQNSFYTFLTSYILLDGIKLLMLWDPYFLGLAPVDSPPPPPISCLATFPLLLRFYHCLVSCVGVYVALNFVTSLNPIFFLGLSLAFPNASRRLTSAPLDVPWLYSGTFGPFLTPILDHGLAGCWGRWWHQLFRYGFTATARWILSLLPKDWATDSRVKRVTYVVVAFSISGFVHACGSLTQLSETHPMSGPFFFFSLQSLGVILEHAFKTAVFPMLPRVGEYRWLRRTANFMFFFSWVLFSGAFIADDFARGALWLTEPIPFSPLRGLGLIKGEGWWCWKGAWFRYWSDGTYWGSGIRVV